MQRGQPEQAHRQEAGESWRSLEWLRGRFQGRDKHTERTAQQPDPVVPKEQGLTPGVMGSH